MVPSSIITRTGIIFWILSSWGWESSWSYRCWFRFQICRRYFLPSPIIWEKSATGSPNYKIVCLNICNIHHWHNYDSTIYITANPIWKIWILGWCCITVCQAKLAHCPIIDHSMHQNMHNYTQLQPNRCIALSPPQYYVPTV